MALVDVQTTMPYPIEDVFDLTINLEKAPHWHNIFTDVQQLTPDPIGTGSCWKMSFGVGSFELEIVEFQPPVRAVFMGSALPLIGTIPHFTIELESLADGTRIRYLAHPRIPLLIRPLMALIAPPWGRWDLAHYFREFEAMMAT